MKNIALRKTTYCSVITALATLAFMLESLFPPIILPGARMGVSNVFILLAVIMVGRKYGFICLTLKIIIGSLFSGNISSAMYSLPAGLIALAVEIILLFNVGKISIPAVSIAGAVINSAIQNVVFCLVTGVPEYLYYAPYLTLIAIISGLVVGLIVYFTIKSLPKKLFLSTIELG